MKRYTFFAFSIIALVGFSWVGYYYYQIVKRDNALLEEINKPSVFVEFCNKLDSDVWLKFTYEDGSFRYEGMPSKTDNLIEMYVGTKVDITPDSSNTSAKLLNLTIKENTELKFNIYEDAFRKKDPSDNCFN